MNILRILSFMFCLILVVSLMSCNEYWDDDYYSTSETVYIYEEYWEEDVDDDDASGGLEYWSSLDKGYPRQYYGTYELNEYHSTCNDHVYDDPDLELPAYLNVYSYDNWMDFETSVGYLVWNAEIYSDGTFEFETNYLDWYGHPSVEFPCSCGFYELSDGQEVIDCSCEPSNTGSLCTMNYDLI